MNFSDLAIQIQQTSQAMQQSAMLAVNSHLTIRNWLIGFYIVEFEQKGEDRAKYGEKLLQNLAERLNEDSYSYRNLNLFRQFFLTYLHLSNYIRQFLQFLEVEYATADSDKDIFVSKYLLELPSKEKLIKFIKSEISKF